MYPNVGMKKIQAIMRALRKKYPEDPPAGQNV